MVIARIAAGVVLLAALTACGDEGSTDGGLRAGGADPDGSSYVVTGVTEGGLPYELVDGTEITVRFAEGRLAMSAGCNAMSGDYTVDGTRLTVAPLAMTEMGCAKARMEQDSWLAGLFERPVQFSSGADAAIISGGTVLSLEDRETASPDVPLVGTEWTLETSISGPDTPDGSASSVPGPGATLELMADGGYRATWGCGSSEGGKARVAGSTIVWESSVSGIADCARPVEGAEEVGELIRDVLAGRTTFTLEQGVLTITKGDRALGFRTE